jgi:hypothetical protein
MVKDRAKPADKFLFNAAGNKPDNGAFGTAGPAGKSRKRPDAAV